MHGEAGGGRGLGLGARRDLVERLHGPVHRLEREHGTGGHLEGMDVLALGLHPDPVGHRRDAQGSSRSVRRRGQRVALLEQAQHELVAQGARLLAIVLGRGLHVDGSRRQGQRVKPAAARSPCASEMNARVNPQPGQSHPVRLRNMQTDGSDAPNHGAATLPEWPTPSASAPTIAATLNPKKTTCCKIGARAGAAASAWGVGVAATDGSASAGVTSLAGIT